MPLIGAVGLNCSLAALALASAALASNLQAQPAQQAQQAAAPQSLGPDAFIAFAAQAVSNLDQGRAALVYDRSSAGFKASIAKDRFVGDIARKRDQVGKIVTRQWIGVSRSSINANGRQQPLVIVTLVATNAARQSFNETVQFTLEPDNGWHIANYTF